jgi:hypothetical protein
MDLTKGEFTQYTVEGRLGLLAIEGILVAKRKYARTTFFVYKMSDFYVSKAVINADNSLGAVEIISDDIVHELFLNR